MCVCVCVCTHIEKGGGRDWLICCYTYLCTHWLILVCALTGDQTWSLNIWGRSSNWLEPPGQGLSDESCTGKSPLPGFSAFSLRYPRPAELMAFQLSLPSCPKECFLRSSVCKAFVRVRTHNESSINYSHYHYRYNKLNPHPRRASIASMQSLTFHNYLGKVLVPDLLYIFSQQFFLNNYLILFMFPTFLVFHHQMS